MTKLSYACVLTRDIARLVRFYREVLQAEPTWTDQYAEFPTEGGVFSLWSMDAFVEIAGKAALSERGGGPIMLEFQIDNVDAQFERLQHLDEFRIEFIIPPTTMKWGNRSIYFRDPDGNLLNLFSRVDAS